MPRPPEVPVIGAKVTKATRQYNLTTQTDEVLVEISLPDGDTYRTTFVKLHDCGVLNCFLNGVTVIQTGPILILKPRYSWDPSSIPLEDWSFS